MTAIKVLTRVLILLSAFVFYVWALTLTWNWHLAGLGLEFAGEYKFNLPTVEWSHVVAVMVFRAWFANTASYDKLDSEATEKLAEEQEEHLAHLLSRLSYEEAVKRLS